MTVMIRHLTEDDWSEFAQTRLQALQTDPKVFGSNYQKESQMTETNWRNRLKINQVFLIYESATPIGMTGVSIHRDDASGKTAILWGSWLATSFRGRGLSALMYQTRINWAKQQPVVERIIVSHRASNLASKRAIQKHGFVVTHTIENLWADGTIEDIVSYELKIER